MDPGTQVVKAPPLIRSQRFLHATFIFFGTLLVYSARVNISVAIICMVRDNDDDDNDVFNATSGNGSGVTSVANLTMVPTMRGGCSGLLASGGSRVSNDRAEFDWDKTTRANLLAMYFYGYIFTQIPSGWLASRYGGKRVWGVCMFVSAVCTILTPISARSHVYEAYATRFILGFAAGVTFPCAHALLGQWCAPLERSILTAFSYAGAPAGNILTFAVSGLLCEYGFDNGWGSIFYLCGILNLLWVVGWFYLTADSPRKHKKITERERTYIQNAIGKGAVKKVRAIPWVAMFTSGPLWAIIMAHMCNNWLNYTLLTSLPAFMKESLKFDIKQNGLLSALPYIMQSTMSVVSGKVADILRTRKILNTKMTRKTFQCLSFAGIAVCIACVGQMSCEQRNLAVLLLCVCTTFASLNKGGYSVNHIDLAPSYSGILFGITNTVATVPGMVAPIVAGALTPSKAAEEWRLVFYICSAVAVLGFVLFAILADGELQDWAVPKDLQIEIEIAEPALLEQETEVKNHEESPNIEMAKEFEENAHEALVVSSNIGNLEVMKETPNGSTDLVENTTLSKIGAAWTDDENPEKTQQSDPSVQSNANVQLVDAEERDGDHIVADVNKTSES